MEYLMTALLMFTLACLVHLEWEVGAIKTKIDRLNNKPAGKKKRKEVTPEDENNGKID